MRNTSLTTKCVQCGNDFHPHYGRDDQFFCSPECYLKNRWGDKQPHPICPICGKEAVSSHRTRIYCSWECAQKGKVGRKNPGRSNRLQKPCEWCGKNVDRPAADFHTEKVFCGYDCMAKWQSKNTRQENHPRWAGGRRNARGCGWKAAKTEARRLSKGLCKVCKVKANTVHHKIPVRCFKSPSDAHRQSNLIVLCSSCHPKMEKIFRETAPLLDLIHWKNQDTPALNA